MVRSTFTCLGLLLTVSPFAQEDPYHWLEDVRSDAALKWVTEQNSRAEAVIAQSPEFTALQARIKKILDSKDRIPFITKRGDFYYNFWQDENKQRGVLRRTTLAEYRKTNPKWLTVLDVDQLGKAEAESWVYRGSQTLQPSADRTLISLSRGGSDAVVVREFDLTTRSFQQDGFMLPEAKSDVAWLDKNEILVATDFGNGTLTASGYPRIVKRWTKGQPLAEAFVLFEGEVTDVGIFGFSDQTKDFERAGVTRAIDFFNSDLYLLVNDELVIVDKPRHASTSFFRDWILFSPKQDWHLNGKTHPSGSLLAADVADYLEGNRDIHVIFEPTASRSLAGYTTTRNYLLFNVLNDVRNQIEVVSFSDGSWTHKVLHGTDGFQTISVSAVDESENDDYFLTQSDFVTPPTFSLGGIAKSLEILKQEPPVFDTQELAISQHWATSQDGTKIPYFQIGATEIQAPQPTLLYGYGGFEIELLPSYQKLTGAAWLELGGIYVVANIRGGGEFGPTWHRAALKEKRQNAYDDFIAVAEDLIKRGITTPDLLGTTGGSNGGLLVGNMLTQRPDLFGAIVANVPLFDMQRYHLLLAGASWMAEYGNPDIPEEWGFLRRISPYHNLSKTASYPPLFVTTSTADDRVHPGHARKLVARMLEFGKDVSYFENLEGGHAGAADNAQRAYMSALQYTFLRNALFNSNEKASVD